MHTKTYDQTTYIIAHNGSDVIHPVTVEPGTTISSGQPEFEEFTDKDQWTARLQELGFDASTLELPSLPAPPQV